MGALSVRDQEESFIRYATSGALDKDETYTIELLIDLARMTYDPGYWDDWSERDDAREAHDYKPAFDSAHLSPTFADIYPRTWLSFQRLRDKKRPLRSLAPFRFFPNIERLILQNNEVTDLSALSDCPKLRRLSLVQNPIRTLVPLTACPSLEELELHSTPVSDLTPLARIPHLRTLGLSGTHATALRLVPALPTVEKLSFDREPAETFKGFPEMPKLKIIERVSVSMLDGLDRYPSLENLDQVESSDGSLESLGRLQKLTHLDLWRTKVRDLSPLASLNQLRSIRLSTETPRLDLGPLSRLPLLHQVSIACEAGEVHRLKSLQKGLSPWDTEFGSEPRFNPSLELEVVTETTFDQFDSVEPYGLTSNDTDEGMLSSEHDWMVQRLTEFLVTDFSDGEDFAIPHRWNGARSFTLVLHSAAAVSALPRIVTGIHRLLATAKNDWIIYFQSDDQPEDTTFISWVYPTKIQTTARYAAPLQRLLKGRENSLGRLAHRFRRRIERLFYRR